MEIIVDNANYDNFLKTRFVSGNFLQSSLWRDFLISQQKNIWQVAVNNGGQIVGLCLFYQNRLPLGKSYLYSPKGPILSDKLSLEEKTRALELILSKIRDVTIDTTKSQEIFFKFEPEELINIKVSLEKSVGVQPQDTWVLDLNQDTQKILFQMHPKIRYNIGLAEKKGVIIEFSKDKNDLKHFLRLIKETAKRNQINIHSDEHYHLLWQNIIKHKAGELCLAKIKDRVIAVNLVIYFGAAATYVHGGSDYSERALMAPPLLQWESIKRVQGLGYTIYDFWGVAPADGSKPSWTGITRFKKSFGGRSITSPGAYDLIYDEGAYNLYNFLKKIKRAF